LGLLTATPHPQIFVSTTTTPAQHSERGRPRAQFLREVEQLEHTETSATASDAAPQHILLCGWRREWSLDPKELRERMLEIGQDLPEGSSVTFLNAKTASEMEQALLRTQRGQQRSFDLVSTRDAAKAPLRSQTRATTARVSQDSADHEEDDKDDDRSDGKSVAYTISGGAKGRAPKLLLYCFTGDPTRFDDLEACFELR